MTDNSAIISEYFSLLDRYFEMQYVVELCRPWFGTPKGDELIQDLLMMSLYYSTNSDEILKANSDILTSPEYLDMMSERVAAFVVKITEIKWTRDVDIYVQTTQEEFSSHVSKTILTSTLSNSIDHFAGREWYVRVYPDAGGGLGKELVCKNRVSAEHNGATVRWVDGFVTHIGLVHNDVNVLSIYRYNDGTFDVYQAPEPTEVPLEIEVPEANKSEESGPSWSSILAGASLGVLLSTALKSGTKSQKETKKVFEYEEKKG